MHSTPFDRNRPGSLARAAIALALVACTAPEPGSASREPETASSSPSPDAWPRCYSLSLGKWTEPIGRKVVVTHPPPAVVRLDTVPVSGVSDGVGRRLTPGIPALEIGGRGITPSWARLSPDSLQLLWSSGFEGVFVTLAEKGDSVIGTARAFTDFGAESLAPVTGRRTACTPDASR